MFNSRIQISNEFIFKIKIHTLDIDTLKENSLYILLLKSKTLFI